MGGLLDINQMSMADINNIAQNADNLIQIIQSIKEKSSIEHSEQAISQGSKQPTASEPNVTAQHNLTQKIEEAPYGTNEKPSSL